MLRLFLLLTLAIVSAPAAAGIRATYGTGFFRPMVVEIADNGDLSASLPGNQRLTVVGGHAFVIEERLTGPVVTRLDDLQDLAMQTLTTVDVAGGPPLIVPRGTAEVSGRSGRAYFMARATGRNAERPAAVISSDPTLGRLASAMRRVFAAQLLLSRLDGHFPPSEMPLEDALLQLLDQGAPLSFIGWNLRSFEQVPIDPAAFALPAEPETAEAMRRRRAPGAQETGPIEPNRMITRAVFAAGRLWLRTEQGELSSLAEGERVRRIESPGDNVLDLCVQDGSPVVLTGQPAGERWTIRHRQGGAWAAVRTVARSDDTPIALACGPGGEMLLTSRRLIDLEGSAAPVTLSAALAPAWVQAVVHVTPEAAWVGLDQGEWGGGLRRIDRRTGAIRTIERNATGGLCDGPLNTACDPVNGIVTIPWRPRCVAVAIGLIHMMASGRVTAICPDGIAQLFAAPGAIDPGNAEDVARAATGLGGSIAFFGLAATPDALVAVGQDGLYRIEASGAGTRRPWPRFSEIDGILVSFALPDVVLVLTEINGHASLSRSTPLMAVR